MVIIFANQNSKLRPIDHRYKDSLSIYVTPPGDDTRHRGPMNEFDRLIYFHRVWRLDDINFGRA